MEHLYSSIKIQRFIFNYVRPGGTVLPFWKVFLIAFSVLLPIIAIVLLTVGANLVTDGIGHAASQQ